MPIPFCDNPKKELKAEYETTDQLRCHCCDTKMVIDESTPLPPWANSPSPPMPYYYLTVAYRSHQMEIDEDSVLVGPFQTEEERQAQISSVSGNWDLEENVVNVTLLEVRDNKILSTGCGLATSSGHLSSHA